MEMHYENYIAQSHEIATRHHPSASEALEQYASLLPDEERTYLIEHAHRTEELVKVFAGDLIARRLYDAVMLHDVAQRVTSSHENGRSEAAEVLFDYFTNPTLEHDSGYFVSSILGDLSVVESAAEKCQADLRASTDEDLQAALAEGGCAVPSSQLWLTKEPQIDIPHLKDLCENVNIESVIIKATEALDNIIHPPSSDVAVFKDVLEIETFYAPICEIMGFDALAMKLRSETSKQRLIRGSKEPFVVQSEQVNLQARELGPAWAFHRMFRTAPKEKVYEVNDTSYHPEPIVYGVTRLNEMYGDEREGTLHYRIKSVGSYAKKIERDGINAAPMDVLGLTVTVDSSESVGSLFEYTVEHFAANSHIEFTAAPSKESPLYIQGCSDYIQQVTSQLSPDIREGMQVKELPNDPQDVYQVCKMTFFVKDGEDVMPVEMQFVTAPDRRRARVGRTAHILFKQQYESSHHEIDYDELTAFLEAIYERKHKMDSNGMTVNKQSLAHGEALLGQVTELIS